MRKWEEEGGKGGGGRGGKEGGRGKGREGGVPSPGYDSVFSHSETGVFSWKHQQQMVGLCVAAAAVVVAAVAVAVFVVGGVGDIFLAAVFVDLCFSVSASLGAGGVVAVSR